MWGLTGVEKASRERGYGFVGIDTRAETAVITGKISGENHPFVEHFKFVKQFESLADGLVARQTIPAPAQTLATFLNVRNTELKTNCTDGEFRRSWWHLDFMWGLGGVQKIAAESGHNFVGIQTRAEAGVIVGNLSGDNHPFVEHFKFVKQFESLADGLVARQTIPAPAQTLATFLNVRNTELKTNWRDFYASEEALIEDIGAAYRTVIKDLYAAGCRSVQIDDCTWPVLCDEELVKNSGLDVDHLASLYLKANNAALQDKPEDLRICTHICRGNYRSHYFSKGSYDRVANVVFAHENVDAFYLEYDDERSGTFEALQLIPKNKQVVLGVITSKRPELEDEAFLEQRIAKAAEYFPLDNLCLSPQCGFASTEEGAAYCQSS